MKSYECEICHLHYESEELAKSCARWCSTHASCNLEITGNSIEAREETGFEL